MAYPENIPSINDMLNLPTGELAALVFGEGMSAPLMAELRERRGLVYYAACSADLLANAGEFVVEASFASDKLDEVLTSVAALLRQQAEAIAPLEAALSLEPDNPKRKEMLDQARAALTPTATPP